LPQPTSAAVAATAPQPAIFSSERFEACVMSSPVNQR
jgi:hypothetical protein